MVHDDQCFSDLVLQLEPGLINAARRKLPRMEDAEDVVQLVFIDLYKVWEKRPIVHLRALAFSILHRKVADWFRKHYREPPIESSEEDWGWIGEDTDREALQELAVDTVFRVLSGKQLGVVVLHIFGGFSLREVAAALGWSLNEVKGHWSRACSKLVEATATETVSKNEELKGITDGHTGRS